MIGHKAAEELGVPSGTICADDKCNDAYGRIRMHQALQVKQPEGIHIPSEPTVYRVYERNWY